MNTAISKTYIQKLKQQRRVVGLLRFENRDSANFAKWYALTENLVIKAFDRKSNQIAQLHDIHRHMTSLRGVIFEAIEPTEAKKKFKDLLNVFVEELELDIEEERKPANRRGPSMRMTNTQTVIQSVDISSVIKNVITSIQESEPDSSRAKEAEERLLLLGQELNSKNPKWATVKEVLEWLLSFSRDAFLAVLPVLVEKYK